MDSSSQDLQRPALIDVDTTGQRERDLEFIVSVRDKAMSKTEADLLIKRMGEALQDMKAGGIGKNPNTIYLGSMHPEVLAMRREFERIILDGAHTPAPKLPPQMMVSGRREGLETARRRRTMGGPSVVGDYGALEARLAEYQAFTADLRRPPFYTTRIARLIHNLFK